MPRTIRFHLDEHVAHAVADGLRRLGIEVTTTTDAGLLGAVLGEHAHLARGLVVHEGHLVGPHLGRREPGAGVRGIDGDTGE